MRRLSDILSALVSSKAANSESKSHRLSLIALKFFALKYVLFKCVPKTVGIQVTRSYQLVVVSPPGAHTHLL